MPKIEKYAEEQSLFHVKLYDKDGNLVHWKSLKNLSVGLLFGAYDLRKFRNALPHLIRFYNKINMAGAKKRLEIIYIPLDNLQSEYQVVRALMPWLSVKLNSDLQEFLTTTFKIQPIESVPIKIDYNHFSLPVLLIISSRGTVYKSLELYKTTSELDVLLSKWDYEHCRFK